MAKMLQVEQKKRRLRSRSCVESSLAVAACLITSEVTTCDGAVAGGRLELRPPVGSTDLDEKVLTTTPVRDTSSVGIWVES
jgi:hypothetical protein